MEVGHFQTAFRLSLVSPLNHHLIPSRRPVGLLRESSLLVTLPTTLQLRILERVHDIIGKGGARRSIGSTGDDQLPLILTANIQRHIEFSPEVFIPDVIQEHGRGPKHAARIGILRSTFLDHARG